MKNATNNMNIQMKRDREHFKHKLMSLERKLKDEEDQNNTTIKMYRSRMVEYGNTIQLLHVQSQCFVGGSRLTADEDNSCFKVELTNFPSKANFFIAMGGYKYKKQGDLIHFNDQIILKHEETSQFMHVTERYLTVNNQKGEAQEDLQKGIQLITPNKIDRREPPN